MGYYNECSLEPDAEPFSYEGWSVDERCTPAKPHEIALVAHTPGPYGVHFDEEQNRFQVFQDTGRGFGPMLAEIVGVRGQFAANARLLAAAPDLLAALDEANAMYSWLQSFYNDVMTTAPEYVERCGDWNAVQYMMQDCAGIHDRITTALAQARGAESR